MEDTGGQQPSSVGTAGMEAPVSVGWLILQRLNDLREGQARLEARIERLDEKLDARTGD